MTPETADPVVDSPRFCDTSATVEDNKMRPAFAHPPGYASPSFGGHGTLEMKEVVNILQGSSIPCCMVGVSALIYFGAGRSRGDWEICVPAELLDRAVALLTSPPHNTVYEQVKPSIPQYQSLHHTFPRLKLREFNLRFQLLHSDDCHIICDSVNFEWSEMGLPYPKLAVFTQSLLETHNLVNLADLVDGMNLSEDWGEQNLQLDGSNDVEWAKRRNEKMRAWPGRTQANRFYEMSTNTFSLRETWTESVRNKEQRIGLELPKELFATSFFLKGAEDPRSTKGRTHC